MGIRNQSTYSWSPRVGGRMERRTQSSRSSDASECERCVLKSHELAANSCTLYLALWEGSSNASAPLQSPEFDVNLRRSGSTDVSPWKVESAYERGGRERKKDCLAVREASLGRVAFVPLNCAWTSASAGKARSRHNPTVPNACSRPRSH